MKIHFVEKIILISFLSISNGNVFASDHGHDVNTDINWWSLGSEYCLKPALGWSYFTFVIFALFVVYYANKALKILLSERSQRIKNEIEHVRSLKIDTGRELKLVGSQLKLLDDSIKKITSDSENKGRIENESINLETHLLVENLKKDIDKNIQSYIEQMRHKIKNELVNDAIQEAISNICKESLPYKEDYEKRVIKGLYEIRFANDKKLHVK